MAEIARGSLASGDFEKMVGPATSGRWGTSDAADAISLGKNQFPPTGIPYILKGSNVREIIYCAEDLCDSKTYTLRNNKLYSAGRACSVVGEGRRLSAIAELEQIDQFSTPSDLGLPEKTNAHR